MSQSESRPDKTTMQFLYAERELLLTVGDVLDAPVEAIISPARRDLSQATALAARIHAGAGATLATQCAQLLREHGRLDCGMAVYTGAGDLSCAAVIHAVGPERDAVAPQEAIEQAISRSLQLCDINGWRSLALPALGGTDDADSLAISARASFRAITRFWDARQECALEHIRVCLEPAQFRAFFDAFRETGLAEEVPATAPGVDAESEEERIGYVDLSDAQAGAADEEIDDWFK